MEERSSGNVLHEVDGILSRSPLRIGGVRMQEWPLFGTRYVATAEGAEWKGTFL